MIKRSCVGNGRIFYFNDYGKLESFHICKNYSYENNTSVLFSECTKTIWNRKDAN